MGFTARVQPAFWAKSLTFVASTSDSTPVESSSDAAPQALLEVAQDGIILWAAPEAIAWWEAAPERPLAGRALAGLFAETQGNSSAGWTRLLQRNGAMGQRLTARTPAHVFPVTVQIAPKGEPDASGRDTYIVAIEKAPAEPAPTPAPEPSLASGTGKASPSDEDEILPALDGLDEAAEDTLDGLSGLEPGEVTEVDDDEALALEGLDTLASGELATSPRRPNTPRTAGGHAEGEALESAFAGANLGFFHLDFETGSARFSDTWKRLLGYGPEDVADEPDSLAALIHPEDSEASPLALRRAGPFSAEIRLRTKEDTWRWMQLEGVSAMGEEGAPVRIDGVMLDAQERRDADEETARNEERFLRLAGRGSAGFFELDLVEGRAWYSPEFRRVLGRRADELGSTPEGFLRVLPPEDAAVGVVAFFQSLSCGLPARMARYALMHADGTQVDLDAFLTIRRSRRGLIEHVSGLQVIAAEESPAEHEKRSEAASAPALSGLAAAIQQALDAALEPIVLIDPEARILHVNCRAAMVAGQSPDELTTRPFHEAFNLVLRATGAPASRLLEDALRSGQPLELDQSCQLVGREGPEDVAISCRPVFDQARQLTAATVVLRRLAEMPLTQAELVKSNRMEALGRLACGIVHDFNNLLTTVVGGVSLAMDKRDLAPLEPALKACNNAKNLARQLLTFARGDVAGRRVQSLNDIIRETARMAGAGSKSSIELDLSADLHPVDVVASQLVQVFTNLILNAMQVMPQGGRIAVRTFNMPLGQVNSVNLPAGDYVRVDVQDNGPGIPPENLARIFEPFFTTRAEGTGLGLAMVNSIVAQHDGAIEAASNVGSGTTFTLYFPRAQTAAVQEAPQKLTISYGTGRVLVMDDDVDLCAIASGMLEMLGYEAETASSADEAITKFRKSRELGRTYAAVILDLTMAGGPGGEDVIGRLREIDPSVKAIVSSGYATEEHAEHYRQLGFVGILSKPYRSGDLGRVLKDVIGPPKADGRPAK